MKGQRLRLLRLLEIKIPAVLLFLHGAAPNLPNFCFAKAFGGSNPTTSIEKRPRSDDLGLFSWLGWRDSNPRMPVPKTGALPLGDTPKQG
jgi:hypothetical protein